MNEQGSISGVWRQALAIIRCYPSTVVVPGAMLAALAQLPTSSWIVYCWTNS